MNKFIQFSLIVAIFILALVIYFKPVANRYVITEIKSNSMGGYVVSDTTTGKIYEYVYDAKPNSFPILSTYDVVKKKFNWESVKGR